MNPEGPEYAGFNSCGGMFSTGDGAIEVAADVPCEYGEMPEKYNLASINSDPDQIKCCGGRVWVRFALLAGTNGCAN